MKKTICLTAVAFALFGFCFGQSEQAIDYCRKDIKDPRGTMKPWEKGAWETGKYRNVFLEAGYSETDINAKLTKAYYDVFEGPGRVYFVVGDSMAYLSDLKNHDARTEGLSYGMMVAVQLNKKDVFDRLWR
jgi:oligosaccharide reducing-end xylanase